MRIPSSCISIAWLGLLVSACAADPQLRLEFSPTDGSEASRCRAVFASMAAEIEESATQDAEANQIPGHAFLRANRFLASFAATDMNPPAVRAWVERLRALALDSFHVEVGNLSPTAQKSLDGFADKVMRRPALDAAAYCADLSARALLNSPDAQRKLRGAIEVPDHYVDLLRVVGAYPLTALPVAVGYDRWRRANLGTFGTEPGSLPSVGKRIAYRPADNAGALPAAEVRAILGRSRKNSLGIPEPLPSDATRLINAHAPVWIVDAGGPDDRIGTISWELDDALAVATDRPVVYHRLSWTRFGGAILLQLNYLAWFPARPTEGPLDLLGGALDGVIWRVTLGTDGRPVIYDSIHACGCYHLFFPASPLTAKPGPPPRDIRERAEVPAQAPNLAPGHRVSVWLASSSHYIQALSTTDKPEAEITEVLPYELLPAEVLRRLERPSGGSRSMYRPDGIVDGTERLERFLLWPMGIASPGAMRQWGTHATAFIGRRHFDDPRLFEDAFYIQDDGSR